MDPKIPFNDLPPLPPKDGLETALVLKEAIQAHRELAELKGVGLLIPNQAILIQTIALQEAKNSSEIENIVTTNDELYQAFSIDGERLEPQTKEVLRYNDALWHGFNAITKQNRLLNTLLFEELAVIILNKETAIRKLPGTHLKNPLTNKILYTPPEGEGLIRTKLAQLEAFIYQFTDLDPLIKMALIHYQFEAIHPFYDGNGRTGRILNTLYLIKENLLDLPILYLSKYIMDQKTDYYLGLNPVTSKGDWENWVLYILKGVTVTAKLTRQKIFAIKQLIEKTSEKIKKELPKIYSKDLLELLFHTPYCKIRFLEQAGIAGRQTASLYLQQLEQIGILTCIKKGTEKYYLNREFLDLLTK